MLNLYLISEYIRIIFPGMLLGTALLVMLPRKSLEIRALVHILLFILGRDAMTPARLWSLESLGPTGFQIRFIEDSITLFFLSFITGALTLAIYCFEIELRKIIVWLKGSLLKAVGWGFLGGLLVAIPGVIQSLGASRGSGEIPPFTQTGAVLSIALVGNLYEELIFRGFLQGLLLKTLTPMRAVFISAGIFSLGHSFLSATVTHIGPMVLAFTLYEGFIVASLNEKFGLIAAVLAHGIGIFLLASGLIHL